MQKLRRVSELNVAGKRVLLRVDLNAEISRRKVQVSERFKAHAKTIAMLKRKRARIVVLAHQSRPGKSDFTNLKQHAKLLNRFTKIDYVPDVIGKLAVERILSLKDGEAVLLENVRSLDEEFKPSTKNALVKVLGNLCELYVNDAFSILHRTQTTIIIFPKVMPSAIGPTLEAELRALSKIKNSSSLYILGGAKPDDLIPIIRSPTAKEVLAAGYLGQLALIARGHNLGAQNLFLKRWLGLTKKLKPMLGKLVLPVDYAIRVKGRRVEIPLEDFPSKYEIFDIGTHTQKIFAERIARSRRVLMKGTVGYCEEKEFCKGTKALLRALSNSKAYSVLGGGHTLTALQKLRIPKSKFGYVSLSGGALIKFLAGEKLPGLVALENSPIRHA
ncbi:phosphoglycerate kinase [Candidatus Pacearchaeota archaeon]|nr:MAG: phosphoglycerate kinase [Candidatus Pacearchaeota archaeon]